MLKEEEEILAKNKDVSLLLQHSKLKKLAEARQVTFMMLSYKLKEIIQTVIQKQVLVHKSVTGKEVNEKMSNHVVSYIAVKRFIIVSYLTFDFC